MLKEDQFGPCFGMSPLLETARMFLGQDVIQNVLYNLQKDFGQNTEAASEKKEPTPSPQTSMKDVMDGMVNLLGGEEFVQDVLLNMSGAFRDHKEGSSQASGSAGPPPEFQCPMASQFFKQFAPKDQKPNPETDKKDEPSTSNEARPEFRFPTPSELFQELTSLSSVMERDSEGASSSADDSTKRPKETLKIPSVANFLKAFYDTAEKQPEQKPKTEEHSKENSEPSVRPKSTKSTKDQKSTATLAGEQPTSPVKDELGEEEFKVEIKATGFEPEDIKVKVKDGYLIIQAQREERDVEDGITKTQKLEKEIKLPSNIDPDQISCEMSRGLLTLRAPNTIKAQEKVLKISQKE